MVALHFWRNTLYTSIFLFDLPVSSTRAGCLFLCCNIHRFCFESVSNYFFYRYWNGSGSLQTNAKFQAVAEDLVSKFFHDDSGINNEVASSLAKRDKDLLEVQNRLKDQIAENERLKQRLQNEDEIKRTIELTDKDLVSYSFSSTLSFRNI